jgi:site-specific recombinase XerD
MSSYVPDIDVYPVESKNCPVFLLRYLSYLKHNQGKRPLTLSETELLLREFCQFVHYRNVLNELPPTWDAHKDMGITNMGLDELAAIKPSDIEEYIYFLDCKALNSDTTIYKKVSIIRTFFSYLVKIQEETGVRFIYGNPTPQITPPSSKAPPSSPASDYPDTLSASQLHRLVASSPFEDQPRSFAILLFLSTTGIIPSELVKLSTDDVLPEGWLRINGANGSRYVWLSPACRRAVQRHLDTAETDNLSEYPYLFQSTRAHGRPITTRAIGKIVAKAAENAQLPATMDITPTVLRNSVARILYETANSYEQVNVSGYLGYRMPTQYSRRQTPSGFDRDVVMENILLRSPLANIGERDCKEGTP